MYYKIRDLREAVARLACYAACKSFNEVGSISAEINQILNTIQSDYNEMQSKLVKSDESDSGDSGSDIPF